MDMPLPRVLVLAAAAACLPATASADAPWSAPRPLGGSGGVDTLLTTQIGGRVLVTGASDTRAPTAVTKLAADGTARGRQALPVAYPRAARFGRAGVVLAGSRPTALVRGGDPARAPVVVSVGSVRPIHGLGAPQALPGTRGEWVDAVGGRPGSLAGTVAVVTSTMYGRGQRTRSVWLGRNGRFRRALRFRLGTYARGAAVAVGPEGEVLVAWQTRTAILARQLDRKGRPGPVRRLGAGRQSSLQARIADDGRREVAWQSQRVSEGDALTPSRVLYTSAPAGGRFAPARQVGGSSVTGTGRYVAGTVRLLGTGPSTSVLGWTQFDGARFRVQVADVARGVVAPPQTVSPADDDAILGDLAVSAAGARLVLWLTNTRGADGSGPQRVAAAVQPPGAAAFGPPELVSEPVEPQGSPGFAGTIVPFVPFAAFDERGGTAGRAFAAWTTLDRTVKVAVSEVRGAPAG